MVHGMSTNTTGESRVRPPLQTPMYGPGEAPDPSVGGLGYGMHTKNTMVSMMEESIQNGEDPLSSIPYDTDGVPSARSLSRWYHDKVQNGNVIPKRHTGNKTAERAIVGIPLVMLATYRCLFPKAQRCEVQAFLFRAYSGHINDPFLYSPTAITNAEAALGLCWKKGSTTAYQAMLPENQYKRWAYWNLPSPHGIADVRRDDMIDFDEAGVFLETANRTYGKALVASRVRQTGNYGHGEKSTLLMAISGGPDGQRWVDYSNRAGTSAYDYYTFTQLVCNEIGPAHLSRQ